MFKAKTERLEKLATKFPEKIKELETVFSKPTNIYIDYANVLPWSKKLGWHIDIKRLKQFLDSFDTIKEVKFYYGTLEGDGYSLQFINDIKKYKYLLTTKPVKILRLSVNTSSISSTSPDLLKGFIRTPLLKKFKVEYIEYLNNILKELNDKEGILFIEDRKCNFDVEIGTDMLIDHYVKDVKNFILWSGDSDFVDPINQIISAGKDICLFATVRKVASELNNIIATRKLRMYDIRKIREFICRSKEISCDF